MLSKLLTAILIYSLTLSAQDQNFFPKPGYFRETLVSPNMHVELKPPTRLADFVLVAFSPMKSRPNSGLPDAR